MNVSKSTFCTIEGCGRPHLAHGWCSMHYDRWRRHGDPMACPKVKHVGCSVEGCERKHSSHGYCAMHGQAWRKYGDPNGGNRQIRDGGCQMPGCRNAHKAYGLCVKHYHRWVKWGDPFFDGKTYLECEVRDCREAPHSKGYCSGHYARFKRHGDPLGSSGRVDPIGVRLDVAPLLAEVERRGGLGACLDRAGIVNITQRNRQEIALNRGSHRGYIDAAVADDFAIKVLGEHPFLIWGEDWWSDEIHDDEPELVAA